MILNDGQELAANGYIEWYKNPYFRSRPWYEISGAAGTGKTTVVREIIDRLGISIDDVIFMAFVGKAALALRLSGVNGVTVHSVIYQLIKVPLRDDSGNIIYAAGKIVYVSEFIKVNELPPNVKMLVVDEGGMIGEKMGLDILSFGIPTLVLGDKNQLPPVIGRGIFLNKPDATLTEIMRQKKGSPIIYLSQLAIHGFDIPYGNYGDDDTCTVIRKHELTDYHLKRADLVICGTNSMRDKINMYIRKNIFGIDSDRLEIGDKLICRQNCWDIKLNKDIALVNGMIGYVDGINRETKKPSTLMEIDFRPEFTETEKFLNVPVNHKYMFQDYKIRKNTNSMFRDDIIFEFGHCSTCHLAQGSQYTNIVVFDDLVGQSGDFYKKWLYTAVTRAKVGLTLVR